MMLCNAISDVSFLFGLQGCPVKKIQLCTYLKQILFFFIKTMYLTKRGCFVSFRKDGHERQRPDQFEKHVTSSSKINALVHLAKNVLPN